MNVEDVQPCRTCGGAIYLLARSYDPMVGATGRMVDGKWMNEHWRHIIGDERYCDHGNGAIAEPFNGSGPLAEELARLNSLYRLDSVKP